jgi:hypothetical protein
VRFKSSPNRNLEKIFLTADKTGCSQIIEREEVLKPFILSASCFICGLTSYFNLGKLLNQALVLPSGLLCGGALHRHLKLFELAFSKLGTVTLSPKIGASLMISVHRTSLFLGSF